MTALVAYGISTSFAFSAGPAIVVSGYMANPAGNDANFEYVQLVATQAINFGTTNYSVVWANNGTATSAGWTAGGAVTYGFTLSSGTVNAGDTFYVGGDGKLINGTGTTSIAGATWIRSIATNTVAGDGFGTAGGTAGVLGNGGTNADGIGVFSGAATALTSSSVPIDEVFFGTGVGTAKPATGGYVLGTNDRYSNSQGTFGNGTNTFIFGDPASGGFSKLTGTFNITTGTWDTARTGSAVSSPTALSQIASAITLTAGSTTVNWNVTTGTWNLTTGNWANGSPTSNLYKDGDTASFGNIGSDSVITVLAGGVTPTATNISNAANKYTFSGGSIGGTGAVTKSGNGTAVLASTNSYSGGTNVNGGILVADGGDDRLGNSAGSINFNGGTLRTDTSGLTSARSINVASGGGTFNTNGLNSSTSGTTTLTAATFTKTGSGDLALNGTVTIDATSKFVIDAGGSVTLGQATGTITMKAGGTFNGDLNVNTTARINMDTAGQNYGGTGKINFRGSALGAGSASTTIASGTFTNFNALISNTSGSTAGTITSDVVLNAPGTGHVAFTAGNVTTSNYTTASYLIFVGGTTGATGDGLTFNGKITGEGDLFIGNQSKTGGGAGNITFNAANDYQGNTLINNGGVIKLGVNQALPAATNVVFGSLTGAGNATLDLNGKTLQIASLSDDAAKPSGKNLTVTNLGTSDTTLTVSGSTTPANAFGGVLSDGTTNKLSLAKSGSNTLNLTGVNTYSGATAVHAGKLEIGGSIANSNVTVDGTGVLQLDANTALGDLSSLVFVDSGAAILNFSGFEVVGSLTIGAVTYTQGIFDASTNPSIFSGTGAILVPEPTSLGLVGLGAAALLGRRRRKLA